MTLNVDTEKADKKNNLRKKRFTCPTKSQLGASSIFNRQTHLRIYFEELAGSLKKIKSLKAYKKQKKKIFATSFVKI